MGECEGATRVSADYLQSNLPSPGSEIGEKVVKTMRDIIYTEGDEEKSQLAFGIRDSSLTVKIEAKTKENSEKLIIKFP